MRVKGVSKGGNREIIHPYNRDFALYQVTRGDVVNRDVAFVEGLSEPVCYASSPFYKRYVLRL